MSDDAENAEVNELPPTEFGPSAWHRAKREEILATIASFERGHEEASRALKFAAAQLKAWRAYLAAFDEINPGRKAEPVSSGAAADAEPDLAAVAADPVDADPTETGANGSDTSGRPGPNTRGGRILAYLERPDRRGKKFHLGDVAKDLGEDRGPIGIELAHLAQNGLIERLGEGFYRARSSDVG